MKTYPDCYPCLLCQALSAARIAGASDKQQHQILVETMDQLRSLPADATPLRVVEAIHRLVRSKSRNADPYLRAKRNATKHALALLPRLRNRIHAATDPLGTAAHIAIAGNVIDLGAAEIDELETSLDQVLEQPDGIDELTALRRAVAEADSILYLADNAGETVFDRVLIENLSPPVTYAVKAGPIINDATREDALAAGLGEVAEIIDNGSDAPGTPLARCSEEFRKRFDQADLIIAKGQANYETLRDSQRPIFFLLQAKCSVIARDLGVKTGSTVLKASKGTL